MSKFRVVEHSFRTQHIRQHAAAVEPGHEGDLRLAVKQYIPLSNPTPKPGDATIIAAHANGFPKEIYEPLWDDLVDRLLSKGRRIRSIWIGDVAWQGQSSVLNEHIIGNDPSWFDHPRDLLFMINQCQDEMPEPIIAIGHSFGGAALTELALIHPRLFTGLVLLDPVMHTHDRGSSFPRQSTFRRDLWPSRAQAEQAFAKNKFYQGWDPRVFQKWIQYGLRDLPTALYPDLEQAKQDCSNGNSNTRPVTLATPKLQEIATFLRPTYQDPSRPVIADDMIPPTHHVDVFPFVRVEPGIIYQRLPDLRPSVVYIFGDSSPVNLPDERQRKMNITGAGPLGNGGVAKGRVSEVVLDCGHLVAMERVGECAEASAEFIGAEIARWEMQTRAFRKAWNATARRNKIVISDLWKKHIVKEHPSDLKDPSKL